MTSSRTIYELLNTLAARYIPEGKHELLHINSREMWVDMMAGLIERGFIKSKVAALDKCARNWEFMLVTKLSILN